MTEELKRAEPAALIRRIDAVLAGQAHEHTAVLTDVHTFLSRQQPEQAVPVAWMASYVGSDGTDKVYTTTHRDLAVENDMHGDPAPLYTAPQPAQPSGEVTDEQIDDIVEQVGEAVGVSYGAWDLVNPRVLIRAILALRPAQDLNLSCPSVQARLAAQWGYVKAQEPMTDAEMEKGREAIFSVNNPYCPCDRKTFRKVAQWVECHHRIGITTKGAEGGA